MQATSLPLPKRIPHKDARNVTERQWAWGRCHRLMSNCRAYRGCVDKATAAGDVEGAKLRQAHFDESFVELVLLAKEHGFPLSSFH